MTATAMLNNLIGAIGLVSWLAFIWMAVNLLEGVVS
jgi:hypothetical protein